MIPRPPRSTLSSSSAASDVYKRQVLVLLGEPQSALGSWDQIRGHLVFRDQRNPWRNLHERLAGFAVNPTEHLLRLRASLQLLREAGGERAAMVSSAPVLQLYRWVVLQASVCNLRLRQAKLKQSCNRGSERPFPLAPEPEDEQAA
eukprot:TRINITY_DN32400_c0_g1_i2.p1 TRINITY_DN32400_c0_g1~~TRINITY_DN32400_c0_g1_i2.p1  ORF type:complete len:146 (-),score=45.15 TRINITY_DN32400_c0_g1_i2:182-619(-)